MIVANNSSTSHAPLAVVAECSRSCAERTFGIYYQGLGALANPEGERHKGGGEVAGGPRLQARCSGERAFFVSLQQRRIPLCARQGSKSSMQAPPSGTTITAGRWVAGGHPGVHCDPGAPAMCVGCNCNSSCWRHCPIAACACSLYVHMWCCIVVWVGSVQKVWRLQPVVFLGSPGGSGGVHGICDKASGDSSFLLVGQC